MTTNLAITVPTVHYVGFQKRDVDSLPLGFMTPDGTDKAAEKRKATVDKWAAGYSYHGNKQAVLPSQTLDNKPMVGFKLGILRAGGGRGWDSRNEAWRIQDPRGFELEITSGNLEEIMGLCTIEKGEILEECIWCRHGNSNVLVPIEHNLYKAATINTERMGKTASLKDLEVGNRIVFKNGQQFIYLGRVIGYGYHSERRMTDEEQAEDRRRHGYTTRYQVPLDDLQFKTFNKKAVHAYGTITDEGKVGSSIFLRDAMQLAEIHENIKLTPEEACDIINEYLAVGSRGSKSVDCPTKWAGSYNGLGRVLCVSPEKFEDVDFKQEIKLIGDEAAYLAQAERHHYRNALIKYQDKFARGRYCENWTGYHGGLQTGPLLFSEPVKTLTVYGSYMNESHVELIDDELLKTKFRVERITHQSTERNYSVFGGHSYRQVPAKVNWPDATMADIEFYDIVGNYKTFSGKTYTILMPQ